MNNKILQKMLWTPNFSSFFLKRNYTASSCFLVDNGSKSYKLKVVDLFWNCKFLHLLENKKQMSRKKRESCIFTGFLGKKFYAPTNCSYCAGR